jgi:hypothetical protein
MPKTNFTPQLDGFHFANHFVNNILQIPVYGQITSLGRCGGMSFASLDFFFAHQMIPRGTDQDFAATGCVPADGTPLADYIYRRQIDSFLIPSAAKFITWSVTPDGSTFLLRGVDKWTRQDEFAKLRAEVDAGKPVSLGLVVAVDLSGLPHNHQVVAYGYEAEPATVYIYDNNHPDQEITLIAKQDGPGWVQSSGEQWRGFFVQDYVAQLPPPALSVVVGGPEAAMEKSLAPVKGQVVTVNFDSVRFNGDEQMQARGRVSLTFSVNGVSARWPRSGTRIVKAGQPYEIGKSLEVTLMPDDKMSLQVQAGEALLDGTHIDDNGMSGNRLVREYSSADNWGKGRHTEGTEAGAGGCSVKYTIKTRKAK